MVTATPYLTLMCTTKWGGGWCQVGLYHTVARDRELDGRTKARKPFPSHYINVR